MRLILFCTTVHAVAAQQSNELSERTCDLTSLVMPENADSWSCNKPINQGKVEKYTRCKIVCLDGYDFSKGNNSHVILQFLKLEESRI